MALVAVLAATSWTPASTRTRSCRTSRMCSLSIAPRGWSGMLTWDVRNQSGMAVKRILIVEDEAIIAKHIERALQKLAFQVTSTVSTGEEALLQAAEDRPDLVLMDIMLKGE